MYVLQIANGGKRSAAKGHTIIFKLRGNFLHDIYMFNTWLATSDCMR